MIDLETSLIYCHSQQGVALSRFSVTSLLVHIVTGVTG